jgi:acetylornithine deacetylase/succinyl-diaminopimelate desuccinylase-like protein
MNRVELENLFAEKRDEFIDGWERFLEFPSISADPQHAADCRNCAEWLGAHIKAVGFEVSIKETGDGPPVVFGERPGNSDKPVVLFYGHYDVQPVDPLEEWNTPPFEPTLRDGRLYARGAEDNKGQVFYTIKAIESLIAAEVDLPTIKVIIEGEEEYGSGGISRALDEWCDMLRADVLLVHDTGTASSGAPTITMGLRGIAHLSAELEAANHDLHSGLHGGLAPNPAQGIAAMVAGLFNSDGSVAVAGFYDGVLPPNDIEKKLAESEPFDEEEYRRLVGTEARGGQQGVAAVERVGFLPSLDINGIHSGYGGDGMKTVIASKAIAKISMRLVPNQNPARVLAAVRDHLRASVPAGMRLRITDYGVGGPGFRLDPESEIARKAHGALEELDQGDVVFLWSGASIPIVTALAEASGATPLLVGFGHEDDHIHAPNESFSLEQFRSGFIYSALLLQKI